MGRGFAADLRLQAYRTQQEGRQVRRIASVVVVIPFTLALRRGLAFFGLTQLSVTWFGLTLFDVTLFGLAARTDFVEAGYRRRVGCSRGGFRLPRLRIAASARTSARLLFV